MFRCKTCGQGFKLKKENKYLSASANAIFGNLTLHECFDCPICGCQNIVGSREQIYTPDLCASVTRDRLLRAESEYGEQE